MRSGRHPGASRTVTRSGRSSPIASRSADATQAADVVAPGGNDHAAGGGEHRRLGEAMRHRLHHAALNGAVGDARRHQGGEREQQEQIADLRHGGIGHQHFQARLRQRQQRAPQDRRRAQNAQQLRGGHRGQRREQFQP